MKNKTALIFATLFLVASCSSQQTADELFVTESESSVDSLPIFDSSWVTHENEFRCYPIDQEALINPNASQEPHYPPGPDDSLWPIVQSGLSFQYVDHPDVKAQMNWYLSHPGYLERVQKRASKYMYHIVQRLHEENVPYDLVLLPIVESAFDPFAYSHGQASGLWQFIPGTGKRFKLDQNWWYDARRDAVESTDAAIKYLKYLHGFFDGDWLLAIAAYNAGEGTVRNAIRKNKKKGKPTDFWNLDLPKETSAYVPKMIALSSIFREAEKHQIPLVYIPNKPYFASITLDSQLDLKQAADLANIDINELYYLNAGLNRWATPPVKKHQLKLPFDAVEAFEQALAKLPKSKRVTWKRHVVASGETLSGLAQKYQSDKQLIMQINHLSNHMIRVGQALMIPVASSTSSAYTMSEIERLQKRQNTSPNSGKQKQVYYVQPGDSFWKIAKQFKVSVEALAKWNNKSPKDTLQVGEKLVVWVVAGTSTTRSAHLKKIYYKVRKGDSLSRVAGKFNVAISQIVAWNGINPDHYLQPGQSLTLYVNVMETYQ